MPTEEWSKIITSSVVPVVIISACGLLCLAFYNRLAAIVARLRGFQRERMDEEEAHARHRANHERDEIVMLRSRHVLEMIEVQTRRVLLRARLIQATLLCLLSTIILLTLCSISTGLSVVWPGATCLAVAFFMAGLVLLVAGVAFAMVEMVLALEPVLVTRQQVARFAKELEELSGPKR